MEEKNNFPLSPFTVSSIILDFLFIIIADLASFIIRFNGSFPEINFNAYLELAPFIIALRISTFYIFSLYNKPKYKSNFVTFINAIKACTASSTIIVFLMYFMDIKAYPRTIVFLSWLLTIIFVSSWRFVIKEFVELYLGKDFFQSRFVIIGTGENASEVANEALRDVGVNHKLLGFVITNKSSPLHVPKSSLLGDIDKMASIIKYYRPDEVVIAESKLDKNSLTKLIDLLSRKKIAIKSVSSAYETVIQNMVLYGRGPTPFMGSTVFKKTFSWYWSFKRILDILFSLILLIITLPICLVICVLIKITSPGPVLYLQKRTGLNGKPFIIFKFRTMYIGAEKKGHPHWTRESDARVTLLGRFLRRFRLDELPQLVNVLRNEMSLIGPRPERPYFTSRLIKKIPFYVERLHVKPGISGWAQVGFRYGATEKDAECKLIYDLYYIQNISLSFDFLIALKTLKTVITGSGAQ